MTLSRLLVTASLVLAACADSSYDDSWGADDLVGGKADSLLDAAQLIELGDVGTGSITSRQLDLYAIDLRGGDKITATMRVTSGDLEPHFTVYAGGYSYVGSSTFNRQGDAIVKTYTLEETGRHYIAVRAYQNQGTGSYRFEIACTGGPCNGEPVVTTLSEDDVAECIGKARVCSFAALPQYGGSVGPARARTIFEGCLGDAMTDLDGASCASACDGETRSLCDSMIAALPFYADVSAACLGELGECLEECTSFDPWGSEPNTDREWKCWESGFNGTCDGYARGHEACGGSEYAEGSVDECKALCQSTDGAWVDDLDVICDERCE